MMEKQGRPETTLHFERAFQVRPAEELYDLRNDPDQLTNVAADRAYADAKRRLAARLLRELTASRDPRALGQAEAFDKYPYYGGRQPER